MRPFSWASVFALGTTAADAQQEELRIGFIAPVTGIFAQVGQDMVNGFQMYLDEVNGDFAGAKVKLIVEDEQGKPDAAVAKAKKLTLQDKVHMITGAQLASTGYALGPVSTQDKTVFIPSVTAADDLTQRDLAQYPYMIRTGWTSSQPMHPLGQWACEQGYKKIVAIGADFAFGARVGRRISARLRGLRRADHPEDMAPARHQGFRAVHPDDQGGRRRDLHADAGTDGAAVSRSRSRRPATRSR